MKTENTPNIETEQKPGETEMDLGFGERKCPVCGKFFKPTSVSQVACSNDCRIRRKKALKKRTNARYQKKRKELFQEMQLRVVNFENLEKQWKIRLSGMEEEIVNLTARLINFEKANKELDDRCKNLESLLADAQKGKTVLAPDNIEHCERMHVAMSKLPCGLREECFLNPRCDRIPEGYSENSRRQCAVCGNIFVNTKKGPSKYCSEECRKKALKDRKKYLKKGDI